MLSNLTAEQKHILQILRSAAGLAADLSNSEITVYLNDADKRFLNIYLQEKHLLQREEARPDMTGRRIRRVEEPLVSRVLQRNISVEGIRERYLGIFYSFKIFPVRDRSEKCFAAVSFASADPNEIITEKVLELLLNLREPVDGNKHYGRLTPSDGVLAVDKDRSIIAANDPASHIFRLLDIKDFLGRRTSDIAINWPLVGMVIDTGIAEGKEMWLNGMLLSMRVLPTAPRSAIGCGIVILRDITQLRQKEEELRVQAAVIREIHHRVKNNLQTIAGLLRLQERRAEHQETKDILHNCIDRVNSIGIVHEYLSRQEGGSVNMEQIVQGIYRALTAGIAGPDMQLSASIEADEARLPSEKAVSIGLVLNELLQNALTHAFTGRSQGALRVEFKTLSHMYLLSVADDGVGLPREGLRDGSLGLKIIKTIVESDLRGKFSLKAGVGGGVLAQVEIPKTGENNAEQI